MHILTFKAFKVGMRNETRSLCSSQKKQTLHSGMFTTSYSNTIPNMTEDSFNICRICQKQIKRKILPYQYKFNLFIVLIHTYYLRNPWYLISKSYFSRGYVSSPYNTIVQDFFIQNKDSNIISTIPMVNCIYLITITAGSWKNGGKCLHCESNHDAALRS